MNLLKKKIFNVLILLFFVVSCASDDGEKVTIEMIEKDLYDQAQSRLKAGNYAAAILSLETLEKQFPFGKYAEQAQSELIFAYYKSSLFEAGAPDPKLKTSATLLLDAYVNAFKCASAKSIT